MSYSKFYNMLAYIFHNAGFEVNIYRNSIIFPTPSEVEKVLRDNNDSLSAGHLGTNPMSNRLNTMYWRKNMRHDIGNCQELQTLPSQ